MEIRTLKYFWTIAEEGTISKAAKALHITQPTLSRQLRELENELGTSLFIRGRRKLQLTDAGLFLKTRAEEILQLTQQTNLEFENRRKQLFSGRIAIGCVEADNSDTLALILEKFVQDYPQVTFTVYSGTSDDITTRLDKGLLDVAVLLKPVATEKYGEITLPRTERWGLLVSKDSSWAKKNAIQPADLREMPLFIAQRPEVRQLVTKWSGIDYAQLKVVGNFNLIFNVLALVKRQVGQAFGIEGATAQIRPEGVKFIPLQPEVKTNCVLVWRRERNLTPVVNEFINYFKDAFGAYHNNK
ncbi:LysR family transcriptional regulator [Pediococcus acidilactici]|jgi:DNA-binding transcriptional LysR family regulator|uniref:LysR family transcriptional regulator n=1 Tax=Pediococcus acidilactici TaxID=1254 RepID=A0AAN5Y7C3_PEDAC|nr:LysR family transcriptional regulator [Pediococcus acidilactici]EOA08447.1 aminoethylphosphonate catabolism associated LysR family transcriptional regulator [Pediococcus acidilactici D3]APR29210.1 LysR family transcriptional regulator [Pediococcus acidilactici]KAF0340550.1 LysR family transcriptional regulator [Pediococcus acidilactici]KAF0352470.1 LysR family transcriptional regulator [Pediococcus acidilactici]KAF0356305.1 LysR family transcriptional regulator [Pediococcus acidilactici]